MKKFSLLPCLLWLASYVLAAEGLWMPATLPSRALSEMKDLGCELQQNEIYSERTPCLKDQIIAFNTGASGIVLSEDGLVLVPASSLVSHLPEGVQQYAAATDDLEMHLEGIEAYQLISTENVTWRIWPKIKDLYDARERKQVLDSLEARLLQLKRLKRGTLAKLHASEGGNFQLCVYRHYTDVRLCYLPEPWWREQHGNTPRHTADLALVRLYDDRMEAPREAASMTSTAVLSTDTPEEGAFVLALGYPQASYPNLPLATWQERNITLPRATWVADSLTLPYNPHTLAQEMDRLAALLAQSEGAQLPDTRIALENAYMAWAANLTEFESQLRYAGALAGVRAAHERRKAPLMRSALLRALLHYQPALVAVGHTTLAQDGLLSAQEWRTYFASVDTVLWKKEWNHLCDWMQAQPDTVLQQLFPEGLAQTIIAESPLFLTKSLEKNFRKDKPVEMPEEPLAAFRQQLQRQVQADSILCLHLDSLCTSYTQLYYEGLHQFRPSLAEHPDGNGTLRLSYGTIQGYSPYDGVSYLPFTTISGLVRENRRNNLPTALRDADAQQRATLCQFLIDVDYTPTCIGAGIYNERGELIGYLSGSECAEELPYSYHPEQTRFRAVSTQYIRFLLTSDEHAERFLEELTWNEEEDSVLLQYVAPTVAPQEDEAPAKGTFLEESTQSEEE